MANKYKYTYGRKVTEEKYLDEMIMLPAIDNNPNWTFMERYIREIVIKQFDQLIAHPIFSSTEIINI